MLAKVDYVLFCFSSIYTCEWMDGCSYGSCFSSMEWKVSVSDISDLDVGLQDYSEGKRLRLVAKPSF